MENAQKKIEVIEVLRFFAAIAITLYHSGAVGNHGFAAVELFFLISGYVTMLSSEKRGPENPGKMFFRKVFRIVPLYWCASIFMYILIAVKPELSILSEAQPEYLIKSLLFVPFMNSRGNTTPILGCGWTLNYEVLFLLIFAVASALSYQRRGWITAGIIVVFVAIGRIVKLPFVLDYWSDWVLLEFAMGIGVYALTKKVDFSKLPRVLCCALAAILLAVILIGENMIDLFPRCFMPGIPMALVLLLLVPGLTEASFSPGLVKGGGFAFEIYIVEYFTTAAFKVVVPVITSHITAVWLARGVELVLAVGLVALTVWIAGFVHEANVVLFRRGKQ